MLSNERLLVVMKNKFSFFNAFLENSHDVTLSSVIDGLDGIKLVSNGKNCNFTNLSEIKDMDKIRSFGVQNQYTGERGKHCDGYYDRDTCLILGIKVKASEETAKPTISVSSFKNFALMLSKIDKHWSLLNLGDDKLLLGNLIISAWQVVAVIRTSLQISYAFKVPFFDLEKFPYVIFKNSHTGFYLLNL